MPAWPSLRFLAIVTCLVSFVGAEAAVAQTVGTVTRVEKEAQVGSRPAVTGTPVNMNVELRTGMGARLQNTFIDDTTLTLGENARVVVDRYVFNPETSTGALVLDASTAAMRFATGKVGQMRNKDVTVNTPFAALSVRGTEFWAGFVDYKYGVVLLSSTGTRVGVSNSLGSVVLNEQYEGTDFEPSLKGTSAPGRPYIWDAAKINRAVSQTNFGLALGPQILVPGLILIPILDDDDRPASPE
jgi:FecR protein